MSENTQVTNKTMLYLLGVVVVLLIVIVALVVVRGQGTQQVAAPTATNSTGTAPAGSSMPGVKPSASADFDVKTATKVPSGTDPKAYVSNYYQAILDKKWETAFKMQPAASQAGGTAKDFEQTQTGYGMKSFKVADSKVEGDTATVIVAQDLGANGTWTVTWTFVKNGADWVVKSRQVAMGGQ